jgi:hypothetical protein
MQNAGSWNPTAQERIESVPPNLRTLTAANEHGAPQPADATAKDAQHPLDHQLASLHYPGALRVARQNEAARATDRYLVEKVNKHK